MTGRTETRRKSSGHRPNGNGHLQSDYDDQSIEVAELRGRMDTFERSLATAVNDIGQKIDGVKDNLKIDLGELRVEMANTARDVAETKDVVALYQAAKTWSGFLKWFFGLGAAAIGFWMAVKAALPFHR